VWVLKDNIVYEKAFSFAVKVVNLYKYLCNEQKEYVLSKQMLKSGTSIGANIKEGIEGQSKRDFLSKMSIALKEASETEYWLGLLRATNYIDDEIVKDILSDCKEINRILSSIVKTTRKQLTIDN
jgi:four helix bundle protein